MVAQYRHAGQTRRFTATLSGVLTPEQARGEAKRILAKVALGEDPATEQTPRCGRPIHLRHAGRAVLSGEAAGSTASHVQGNDEVFAVVVRFGPLHNVPVDSVTRRDIASRVMIIARESGQVAAARARTTASGMYAWAMASGLTEVNRRQSARRSRR